MEFIFIVLFCTIILPIWLILHYTTKWKSSRVLSNEETRLLEELWQSVNKMESRINTLETILSSEQADWRKKI